jgi:hypothetical protein
MKEKIGTREREENLDWSRQRNKTEPNSHEREEKIE